MSGAAGSAGVIATPRNRNGPAAWFVDPYVQIGVGALLVTASELLLRRGAMDVAPAPGVGDVFGLGALASAWTWGGIVLYILSFVSWLHVLRFVPLSIAFSLINVVHILVPIGAWLLLEESISHRRWLGIVLVLAGLTLVARPVARIEAGAERAGAP